MNCITPNKQFLIYILRLTDQRKIEKKKKLTIILIWKFFVHVTVDPLILYKSSHYSLKIKENFPKFQKSYRVKGLWKNNLHLSERNLLPKLTSNLKSLILESLLSVCFLKVLNVFFLPKKSLKSFKSSTKKERRPLCGTHVLKSGCMT